MKLKILENIGNNAFTLFVGDIVDTADYPDSRNWVAAGIASIVEEIETASFKSNALEIAAITPTKKRKSKA